MSTAGLCHGILVLDEVDEDVGGTVDGGEKVSGQCTSSFSTIPACFISQILGTHFPLWIRMNTAKYVSELIIHYYHRQSPD